mgnify:CR=1 FL=1
MRRPARLLALVGAALLGWFLLGSRPHDVVLVYDVPPAGGATALEVDLRSGGALVRHARLVVHPGEQARHLTADEARTISEALGRAVKALKTADDR